MSLLHYIGILSVFLVIVLTGYITGKKADGRKYSGDKNSRSLLVTGSLVGTLVGGSSTIGTAQLAFNYGFSAWWFTLGGGIGVLLLGIICRRRLYNSEIRTLPELMEMEYGKKSSLSITMFNSLGTFLSIVAQVISATALLTAITPVSTPVAVALTITAVIFYVVFGGALSLGLAGIAKTLLVTGSTAVCGLCAISCHGGIPAFTSSLSTERFFNLFARGFSVDSGAGLSLIVGVLTTQSYLSAMLTAKNEKELTKGTVMTGLLVPLIGIFGIFVGLYMRINCPDINSKMALPAFIVDRMPPFVAGIMLGTLLLAVIGTAAGLSFGIAKMLVRNFTSPSARNPGEVFISRVIMVVIMVAAGLLSLGDSGSLILSWSFMSMGLRGAAAFVPMIAALYMPGRISGKYMLISIIAGPVFTLVGKYVLPDGIDSLFFGILASLIVACVGLYAGKCENTKK